MPNWKGPAEIIDINDTNAKVILKNKIKVLNGAKLKHFFKNVENSEDKEGDTSKLFSQKSDQVPEDFKNIFNQAHSRGPVTRAQAKLIKYKDAVQLALLLLKSETENIDSLCDPSDYCAECKREETYFENRNLLEFQWRQLK